LQGHPDSTGEPEDLPETFGVNGEGLPEKVYSLRQKLYRKAKREPAEGRDVVGSPATPGVDSAAKTPGKGVIAKR